MEPIDHETARLTVRVQLLWVLLLSKSSAVALENGDVLITGGGISRKVLLFSPAELKIKSVASMKLIKKEHTSIAIKDKVYVLGGYDGERSQFLNECEIYDVPSDSWTMAAPMKRAKCAFAATKVNERLNGYYSATFSSVEASTENIDSTSWRSTT